MQSPPRRPTLEEKYQRTLEDRSMCETERSDCAEANDCSTLSDRRELLDRRQKDVPVDEDCRKGERRSEVPYSPDDVRTDVEEAD